MNRSILLTLAVSSLSLAQTVQVQTDRGTLDVKNAPGALEVRTRKPAPQPAPVAIDDDDPYPSTANTEVRVNGQTVKVKAQRTARQQPSTQELADGLDALAGHRSQAWTVDGQNKRLAHRCAADEDVNVTGQSNQVTLSGPCRNVWVSGHGNRVTVEQAGLIDASGFKNHVWWTSGLGSEDPRVNTSGFDNLVQRQQ